VPRRFSGHSRSIFRGTRGPIANCGFLLEARRKHRGCTANHPYPGKETQNGGYDAFRTSNFRGWQAICGKTRYFLHRPLFSTLTSSIHGRSEAAYDARQGSAGISEMLCCGTPWLQMLELRQLSVVHSRAESPDRVTTALLAATSVKPQNFDIFFCSYSTHVACGLDRCFLP